LPTWRANSDRSSWLSIASLREDYGMAPGEYIFFVGFEIHAQDLDKALLTGTLWGHDEIIEVRLNNHPIPPTSTRRSGPQAVEIAVDQGFKLGVNFMQVVVRNGDEGAVGFRAELDLVHRSEHQEQAHDVP